MKNHIERIRAMALGIAVIAAIPPAARSESRSNPGTEPTGNALTFNRDIAPIFHDHCVSCHRPGEIGPMSLTTHAEVRPWAKAIREAVGGRTMPPWSADPADIRFSNDRSLPPAQIDLILRWVDQGALGGDPADLPPMPEFPPGGWTLGVPDIIATFPEFEIQPGEDVYLDPKAPIDVPAGAWVRAVEVRPSNRGIAHHINTFAGDVMTMGSVKDNRKADDPRGKTTLLESRSLLGLLDSLLGMWGAGMPPMEFPEGTGRPLHNVKVITGDLHYFNGTDRPQKDQTRVGIYLGKGELKKHVTLRGPGSIDINIPPGESDYETRGSYVFEQDAYVAFMAAHMHLLGSSSVTTAIYPDGRRQTLLNVPRFDFNWHTFYYPAETLLMPKGTRIEMVNHHDNSPSNPNAPARPQRTRFGMSSYEEMSMSIFFIYPVEGVKMLPSRPADRLREHVRDNPGAALHYGQLSAGFLRLPTLIELPPTGTAGLRIAVGIDSLGAQTLDLNLGEIEWDDRKFTSTHDGGLGRVTLTGELDADGIAHCRIDLPEMPEVIQGTLGGTWKLDAPAVRSPEEMELALAR